MNCCADLDVPPGELLHSWRQRGCLSCQGQGRLVPHRTMLLMLKPDVFNQVGDSQYRFCASPDCPVVYFSRERSFTTEISGYVSG